MPTEKSFTKDSPFPPLEDGKLRLYSMRFCPFAQRTRLVLAHKNIPFETVNINLKSKPNWFLEKNPSGTVPTIEKNGQIVYESAICNDFLDETYTGNALIPSDPYRKARDRILLEQFGKVVGGFYQTLRSQGKDDAVKQTFESNLDLFEKELGKRGAFFGGDSVSILDFLMWPFFERWCLLEIFCNYKPSPDRFPKLHAWIARMFEQPAVKATMFPPNVHEIYIKSYISGEVPDYDYGL
ncbi:glutathione S-transferase omega-1-like isoform X2 [Liolophura sinensis]|uniref:glutathione S-transferase omega-1-like isoform X2 n=1 Tax=Liolophura sinensis TaxID=3198878 RepID=UPI0031580BB2